MWTYKMDVAKGFVFLYDGVVKAVTDNLTSATNAMGEFFKDPTSALFNDGTQDEKEEEEMEKIYKEEEVLELELTLHQGDGLAPKDKNFIGRNVSSDPYAIVEVWPKGIPGEDQKAKAEPIEFGRTPTIKKNLNPVWEHKFKTVRVPVKKLDMEEAQLRVRILDDDFGLGDDDPMGAVELYLQPKKHMDIKPMIACGQLPIRRFMTSLP